MLGRLLGRDRIDVTCTVEVENTFDCLFTHVALPEGFDVEPGDEVIVHGDDVSVPYGETIRVEREATLVRASGLERLWTRCTGDFEFMELMEFSFSSGKRL